MHVAPVTSSALNTLASVADATASRAPAGAVTPDQIKSAAGQFEAILVRQFLQDSVGGMMGGEGGGPSGSVYGYLLTDVLASKLTAGGGLGLSGVIQQQLSPRAAHPAAAKTSAS